MLSKARGHRREVLRVSAVKREFMDSYPHVMLWLSCGHRQAMADVAYRPDVSKTYLGTMVRCGQCAASAPRRKKVIEYACVP